MKFRTFALGLGVFAAVGCGGAPDDGLFGNSPGAGSGGEGGSGDGGSGDTGSGGSGDAGNGSGGSGDAGNGSGGSGAASGSGGSGAASGSGGSGAASGSGGSGAASGSGGSGAASGSGGNGGNGGNGGTPPTDCDDALDTYYDVAEEAAQCNPHTNDVQCQKAAPGVCCDHSVTTVEQYDALVNAVNWVDKLCEAIACPAMPCPQVPSNRCLAQAGSSSGYCL